MADADSSTATQVLATFEIKARPGANIEEALELQRNLLEIARSTPSIGEIGGSSWTNDEGAMLFVYTFKSMRALREFVKHPEHVAVMNRGKEFFVSIKTQIAPIEKQSENTFNA